MSAHPFLSISYAGFGGLIEGRCIVEYVPFGDGKRGS